MMMTQYKHSYTNGPIITIFYIYILYTNVITSTVNQLEGVIHFIFNKENVKTQKTHKRTARHKSNSVSKHRDNMSKS